MPRNQHTSSNAQKIRSPYFGKMFPPIERRHWAKAGEERELHGWQI